MKPAHKVALGVAGVAGAGLLVWGIYRATRAAEPLNAPPTPAPAPSTGRQSSAGPRPRTPPRGTTSTARRTSERKDGSNMKGESVYQQGRNERPAEDPRPWHERLASGLADAWDEFTS